MSPSHTMAFAFEIRMPNATAPLATFEVQAPLTLSSGGDGQYSFEIEQPTFTHRIADALEEVAAALRKEP